MEMGMETKTSKITRVICKTIKSMHTIDFITISVWITGAFLIKAVTNIGDSVSADIRVMYMLFITLYMQFMLVFLCLAVIVHMIKRISDKHQNLRNWEVI